MHSGKPQDPKVQARLKKLGAGGVALVLAGAGLLGADGLLTKWEDGGKTGPTVVYADKFTTDGFAGGLPTACKGLTRHVTDEPIIVGDVWSPEKCEKVAARAVAGDQVTLLWCLERPVTQQTFDALSSLGHNVGMGNACASRAVGLINAGRLEEGCRAIAYTPSGAPNWSFASGKFVQGLHNRRIDEMKQCLG